MPPTLVAPVVAAVLMTLATEARATVPASSGGAAAAVEIADLRERLAMAERRIDALLWGLGLSGATGLIVGRLAARRGRHRRGMGQPTTVTTDAFDPGPRVPGAPALRPAHLPEPPDSAVPPPEEASTQVPLFPDEVLVAARPPEPDTLTLAAQPEEPHVDIDQQAEFLMVLGQDEAAIDLLLDHLRGTGGTSPLPYLRLMQIYRQRLEQAAYERTRERFNQRFNAMAPEWAADVAAQRGLESYPEVVAELQRLWPTPIDARALLETLLYRRGSDDERFDLPAYEALLFLHGLTHDLIKRGEKPAAPVDVLLPIDEAHPDEPVIQTVSPGRPMDRSFAPTGSAPRLPAGAGIDLDLSTRPADPDQAMRT